MTGPQHYREAERLLAEARHEGADGVAYVRLENIAAAQVHATLALAAATAVDTGVNAFRDDINSADVEEWAAAMHRPEASRG
ncbi:hypothetical protein ACFY9Q_01280 [Streptomyces sp. NPDC012389]|uniref:hypothetical protein n=1 Tax=Streptomyces sp. NPDC012389 TaxID=3364830 RepID=UPI0036E71B75